MNYIKFRVALLTLAFPLTVCCQTKTTTSINQLWLGYMNQTRLGNKWGTWTDLHLRTKENFFDNFSTSIVRVGLTRYLHELTKVTVGYAYVSLYPGDNHRQVTQPEHRPWQQIQWHVNYSKVRMMHWVRLEERFRHKILNDSVLADGYNFNWRIRYNIMFQFPLSKKGAVARTWSFVVNNEVLVNFGKQIVNNYFDQNRFFAGFAYFTSPSDRVQIGYMNLFQQLAAGNQYKNIQAARIYYYHNVDLRKKK